MAQGWNDEIEALVQHYGSDVLDASVLAALRLHYLVPTDAIWLGTLAAIEDKLVSDSLVYRYNPEASPDGLQGSEGTFSMCTFWYVDALTRTGRLDDARLVFEKMLTYANHLGLYGEELAQTGEQLGNFPQAFTHLSLITAAVDLDAALNRRAAAGRAAAGDDVAAAVGVRLRRHIGPGRGVPDAPAGARHRVVIVGGGFGGLPASRLLSDVPVDVTLVDRRNHHLFQPLLYQVATGLLSPGQIAPPLRHILRKAKNVRVELAEVTGFDLEHRVVHASRMIPGETFDIPYDSLIVAGGSGQSYFGHDEFSLYAPGMKTIDDALELRRRLLGAFELAETATDEQERRQWLTIALVGAGPTGVELAGQIRELAVRSLRSDFRTFEPKTVRVILLDGGKEPLATFGDDLSAKAARSSKGSASSCGWARASPTSTRSASTCRPMRGPNASRRARWCGPRACRRHRSPRCSPSRPARKWTGPVASRRFPTSRFPGIPKCSRLATW